MFWNRNFKEIDLDKILTVAFYQYIFIMQSNKQQLMSKTFQYLLFTLYFTDIYPSQNMKYLISFGCISSVFALRPCFEHFDPS